MLVSYSDSEGSDDEKPQPKEPLKSVTQPTKPSANPTSSSNFALDKSTGRIKVNIQGLPSTTSTSNTGNSNTHENEPASKRPRLGPASGGGGAFANFNSLLPAPKRENAPPPLTTSNSASQNGSSTARTPARKVFSLRTGAEPAFSRESDAEMREFFAEQNASMNTDGLDGDRNEGAEQNTMRPSIPIPKPAFAKPAPPAPAGKAFMFKPLSVARSTKKKKKPTDHGNVSSSEASTSSMRAKDGHSNVHDPIAISQPEKKEKMNLFSAGTDTMTSTYQHNEDEDEDEIIEDLGPAMPDDSLDTFQPPPSSSSSSTPYTNPSSTNIQSQSQPQSQSLDSIAQDLNLSPAERRQLFGRRSNQSSNSQVTNVVNFNTDAEYAANQQLIASGDRAHRVVLDLLARRDQVQHNPVRAIASGKHSLRQLVTSAATQKEALEESFASGKRNKREAGSKYGW